MTYKQSYLYGAAESRIFDRILFVDPGLEGTGWAFFKYIDTKAKQAMRPADFAQYISKVKSPRFESKAEDICDWFSGVCACLKPKTVVFEMPELWSKSVKSQASAASGNLFKLVYLVGGLGHVVHMSCISLPVLVNPSVWKGQLPKDVMQRRIQRAFDLSKLGEHEADAIGMGLAAQGLL
jgi:hypothetical protein